VNEGKCGFLKFIYENINIKHVEIVLRSWRGGRKMERVNLATIYCKHICKYHNLFSVQLLYSNNNKNYF
jgi:hypothetical protein